MNTNYLVLKNARVIDNSRNEILDIEIFNGKISRIDKNINGPCYIDCSNLVVSHGFIDVHCHLRDLWQRKKGTVYSETRAALKGGFTTICAMPNTVLPINNTGVYYNYLKLLRKNSQTKYHLIPDYKIIFDNLVNDYLIITNDGKDFNKEDFLNLIKYIDSRNLNVLIMSHLCDVNETAQLAFELELLQNETSIRRYHVCHLSKYETLNLIKRYPDFNITYDITPFHLVNDIKNWNINPKPNKMIDKQRIMNDLKTNTYGFIASDHSPHENEKFNGQANIEILFAQLCPFFQDNLELLIDLLVGRPAKLLKLFNGKLEVGQPADLTVFDSKIPIDFISFDFITKGENVYTPQLINNQSLKGQIKYVFINGVLKYVNE